MMLFGNMVNAYTVEYRVNNFNTFQPVENANVSLTNITTISNLTDVYGLASLSASTGDYDVSIIKAGYQSYNSRITVDNDSTNIVYLPQYSNQGIIRLRFRDLTYSQHSFCIYFTDNSRLQGCYNLNDTVTLHNNLNYTWIPDIEKMDLISNPTAFKNNYYLFISSIFMFVIVATIILILIIILIRVYHYVKK
jgi:hypothetical protein